MARRSEKGQGQKPRRGEAVDEVLHAKYLDYCSARICDVFMELEEERVFELARVAEQEAGLDHGSLSFRTIAALLVEKMVGEMALPDYDEWAAAYLEDPERYDQHLLGLWKGSVQPAPSS